MPVKNSPIGDAENDKPTWFAYLRNQMSEEWIGINVVDYLNVPDKEMFARFNQLPQNEQSEVLRLLVKAVSTREDLLVALIRDVKKMSDEYSRKAYHTGVHSHE